MSDSFLLSAVDMALGMAGDTLRNEMQQEINKVIKELADKYAPYFDVKWKVIADGSNNGDNIVKNRQVVIDTYLQIPALSSEFVKVNTLVTITSVPTLPSTKH